ncbi:MAG TPA: M56 family metallopeptidase [Fimbriiglobus sp.]|nr:M56 family metallopeptidase [Fimbriiglobus sp.]
MTDSWLTVAGWLGHTALVGAAVLLLGWGGLRLVKSPARRHRLAAWAVRAAVLAPVLCLLPAWLTVPVGSGEWRAMSGEPEQTTDTPPLLTPPDGTELASAERAPGWDAVLTLDPVAVPDLPPNADWRPPTAVERAPEPKPVTPEATPTPPAAPSPSEPSPLAPRPSPLAAALPLLVSAYALAAALLGQMLLGHVGLVRLVRSARPATARVQALFDELATGFRRRPRVLVSDRVATPVCFGLWRPTVLLPESLARAGAEAQLRWVFAHELDHVRRGDLATGWWVGLARAMYFFVPWYWPLRRELNLAQEYLADAAAAAADGRAVDYAAFLVDLSGGPARVPRMAHAVRAGGSDLFRRVTMLLKSGAGLDRRCPRGWAALAAGGVLSAAVLLSGLGIAQAQDEKPPPEKKAQAEKAEKAKQKAEKARQQAERNRDRAARDKERAAGQDVAAIKKAIAAAAKDGDLDEVRQQVERLEKALTARRPRDGDRPRDGERRRDPNLLRGPKPPLPPLPPNVPGVPGGPFRFDIPNAEQMHKAMEQAEKAMRQAMEQLKDNPEAKEQIERALQAYRKAMEQGRKQAGDARDRLKELRKANPGQFPPGFEGFGKGFGGFPGFDFGGHPGSPRFGVMVSPVTDALAEQLDLPNDHGVVVVQVVPGSVADKAGVKKNDVVLSFAGQEIGGDVSKFAGAVEKTKPGQKVEVVVLRKGKKETLKGIELPKRDRKPGGGFEFKFPGKGEFKFPEGGRFKVPAPGKIGFESMQVQIANDEFTINATKDGTKYQLRGTVENGKAAPSQIKVGEKSYKSLKDVPEEHRDAVKQLLGSVGGAR